MGPSLGLEEGSVTPAQSFLASDLLEILDQGFCSLLDIYVRSVV
jgi:hypothetical protein